MNNFISSMSFRSCVFSSDKESKFSFIIADQIFIFIFSTSYIFLSFFILSQLLYVYSTCSYIRDRDSRIQMHFDKKQTICDGGQTEATLR